TVSLDVIEARARTFSILGCVTQPGQYTIPRNDFRLLDAISLAKDVSEATARVVIVHREASPGKKREIVVSLAELRTDPNRFNLVIRNGDLVFVGRQPELDELKPDEKGELAADYRIGKGDLLSVRVNDLQSRAAPTESSASVSPSSGSITLPLIGEIKLEGKTIPESEAQIAG